eukprot:jgi/Botrbrau1/7306/Bobra.247_3s0003.2
MRILRICHHVPQLELVVKGLAASVPGMASTAGVCALVLVIYASLGLKLFGGALFSCSSSTCCIADGICNEVLTEEQCMGTSPAGDACEWSNAQMNFDNFASAAIVLFGIGTGESWSSMMYAAIDARGPGLQPQRDHSVVASLYFISFMVVYSFCCLNLFVGVTLDTFTRRSQQMGLEAGILLTKEQRAWVETQRRALRKPPKPLAGLPKHVIRRTMALIIEGATFQWFMFLALACNMIFMMLEHYNMTSTWSLVTNIASLVFTIIFAVEVVIKLVALFPSSYFGNVWNCFDFAVAAGSILALAANGGSVANIFRLIRVFRMFRLLSRRNLVGLRMMLSTLLLSIPMMLNVAAVTLLVYFIFGVVGVELFGHVIWSDNIGPYANFQNTGTAMLTLFRMMTGENWNSLMIDYSVRPPMCDNHLRPYCQDSSGNEVEGVKDATTCTSISASNLWQTAVDNCGSVVAPLYFILFQILGVFVLLNLMVAVITETFSLSKNAGTEVTDDDIEDFRLVWTAFDPSAKGYIRLDRLTNLLKAVSPPLGLQGQPVTQNIMLTFQRKLPLKVRQDGRVFYEEVLTALVQKATGVTLQQLPLSVRTNLIWETRRGRARAEANDGNFQAPWLKPADMDASDVFAVKLIQAAVRSVITVMRLHHPWSSPSWTSTTLSHHRHRPSSPLVITVMALHHRN